MVADKCAESVTVPGLRPPGPGMTAPPARRGYGIGRWLMANLPQKQIEPPLAGRLNL
ncbi:hypothetical protein GCM10009558_092480 [Virgisporangium aurantiacum]